MDLFVKCHLKLHIDTDIHIDARVGGGDKCPATDRRGVALCGASVSPSVSLSLSLSLSVCVSVCEAPAACWAEGCRIMSYETTTVRHDHTCKRPPGLPQKQAARSDSLRQQVQSPFSGLRGLL